MSKRITIERVHEAKIEDVWALWTTKKGFESWWGPGGFIAKVKKLELRPGGELHYSMIAKDPEMIAYMKQSGMSATTETKITFTEIEAMTRLAYTHLADFVPGVQPYVVATQVEFKVKGKSVQMLITMDPMHDKEWSERAKMGMISQLDKLGEMFGKAAGIALLKKAHGGR